MNDNDNYDKTITACTSVDVLSAAGRRRCLDGASSVRRPTDIIKSVVHSRPNVVSGDSSVRRATAGRVDAELSRRSHLRPDGPTPAARRPLHRTWNQRLRLSVFQHLSTSRSAQGEVVLSYTQGC